MRIFKTNEKPSMGPSGISHTARKVRVFWDDGTSEICGVSDAAQDVVEFLSRDGRKVVSWTEVEPRSEMSPGVRPD